jgi:flagellar hook-basal body complex protein FliE
MTIVPPIGGGLGGVGGAASEWSVGGVGKLDGVQPTGGSSSFGGMLGKQLQALDKSQDSAAQASQSLGDGTATDPSAAVMAVERARLAMQLAAQIRTKGVEVINDLMLNSV